MFMFGDDYPSIRMVLYVGRLNNAVRLFVATAHPYRQLVSRRLLSKISRSLVYMQDAFRLS